MTDWHIDRLRLVNFRSFEDLTISLSPDLTVLVGINGAGKSAVLDGIAVGLGPVMRELGSSSKGFRLDDVRATPADLDSVEAVGRLERHFPVVTEVTATLANETVSWRRERVSEKGRTTWGDASVRSLVFDLTKQARSSTSKEPLMPLIAYYGVQRLVGVRRASGKISTSRFGAYDAALDPQSDLSRLTSFLRQLSESILGATAFGDPEPTGARSQWDAIERACNIVLQPTGWGFPRWHPGLETITLRHELHGTLPLSVLSTGTKIAAGMAIDLASRAARANPYLGSKELLDSVGGIVLIDEIDLHLHTTWQQQIVGQLRTAFPRVQFVLTTHSPQVLSTVDPSNIRILRDSSVGDVQYAEGLRSDVVLETILGTSATPDVVLSRKLNEYMELVNKGDGRSEKARKLRTELDAGLGGVANVSQLAAADAELAFQEFESTS